MILFLYVKGLVHLLFPSFTFFDLACLGEM